MQILGEWKIFAGMCNNICLLQPGVAAGVPGGAAAAVRERGEAGARAEVLRHPAAAVQPGAVPSRAGLEPSRRLKFYNHGEGPY